jgi:putative spermidine/putrescine transport system ATP-binding protein
MSVYDNLAFGLRRRDVERAEIARRVEAAAAKLRLTEFLQRKPHALSGGQRQRVALARALAVRPRALLLDEPLTALDAKLREQLRTDIDRLLRSLAITAVYVTHDQSEAMALGDRIAVMEAGQIVQIGTPKEIYYRPRTAFVADFIGTMNRLRLDGGASESLFRPEDTRIVSAGEAQFSGTITSAFFLGDHTRLMVDCGGPQLITVETTERREFRVGERLHLAVDPGAILSL